MSVLSWTAVAGVAKYMSAVATGDIAPRAVAQRRVFGEGGVGGCDGCPSLRKYALPWPLGVYWSCGEPGVAVAGESCGCVVAIETVQSRRARRGVAERTVELTLHGRPYAKALVGAESCPRDRDAWSDEPAGPMRSLAAPCAHAAER